MSSRGTRRCWRIWTGAWLPLHERRSMNVEAVRPWLRDLQARIVAELGRIEPAPFRADEWTRAEGGGGLSWLIEGGQVLERAAVLFSHVQGATLPASASAHRPHLAGRRWDAMGVSLVL